MNNASKLVLNQSSMEHSFSMLERGRRSDTVWRRGAAIESRGRFGTLVASASEIRRLRDSSALLVSGGVECVGGSSGELCSDGSSILPVLEGGDGKHIRDIMEALRTGNHEHRFVTQTGKKTYRKRLMGRPAVEEGWSTGSIDDRRRLEPAMIGGATSSSSSLSSVKESSRAGIGDAVVDGSGEGYES